MWCSVLLIGKSVIFTSGDKDKDKDNRERIDLGRGRMFFPWWESGLGRRWLGGCSLEQRKGFGVVRGFVSEGKGEARGGRAHGHGGGKGQSWTTEAIKR